MATFKSEFQALAIELLNDEFADFKRPLIIEVSGDNPDPRLPGGGDTVYTSSAIPLDQETALKLFQSVNADSKYIVALKDSNLPAEITPDLPINFNGEDCRMSRVINDPADAVYFLELVSG